MSQEVLLGQLSAAGLLLTVSSLFYSRVFEGPAWIPPVIGAALLAFVIAVALARTSMGRMLRVLALSLIGVLFVALAVLLPGTSFGSVGEIGSALFDSTIDGWRNTLAETLPIDTASVSAVGFVTVAGWIAGAVTGSLLIGSNESASPMLPGILLAALSLPLAAPNGAVAYLLIAALLASALLLSLVRAVPQSQLETHERVTEFVGERMLTERLVSGVPILVGLALLVPLLSLALPLFRDDPFDPRELRQEEVVTASAINPLAQLKSLRDAGNPVFQLTLPAAPSAVFFDRVSLVSLESYDGVNWTTNATYSATSTNVDIPFERTVQPVPVRQEIAIIDQSFPWLPAGQPISRIETDNIWLDQESGSLLDRSGQDDFAYAVVSEISAPNDEQLAAAVADRTNQQLLELPTISPDSPLNELAATLQGGSDFERLQALETVLREDLVLIPDEASGTAVGRVEEFLATGEGYRDQFVAAFAIAARQQGFPTRITVGYRVTQEIDDTVAFLETVTAEQFDAWPEVLFEGIGWVAFDPVPATSGEAQSNADDATAIPEGQPAREGPTPAPDDPTEDDEVDESLEPASATLRVLVVSGLFFLFFPFMMVLVVVLAKMLRRRYRRNLEDPTERVLAGWQESKDRLLEAGVEIRPDMTVKEIVSASRRQLGVKASSSLSSLAPYVTSTIYSEKEPSSTAADAVWNEVILFDEQLNDSRSRSQNIRARANPRSLLEKV